MSSFTKKFMKKVLSRQMKYYSGTYPKELPKEEASAELLRFESWGTMPARTTSAELYSKTNSSVDSQKLYPYLDFFYSGCKVEENKPDYPRFMIHPKKG